MTVNTTIYTAFRVLTAYPKVTFIACAFSSFLDTNTTITAVVRATLFPTVCTFPTIIAVAFGFQAHSVPGTIVKAIFS